VFDNTESNLQIYRDNLYNRSMEAHHAGTTFRSADSPSSLILQTASVTVTRGPRAQPGFISGWAQGSGIEDILS